MVGPETQDNLPLKTSFSWGNHQANNEPKINKILYYPNEVCLDRKRLSVIKLDNLLWRKLQ